MKLRVKRHAVVQPPDTTIRLIPLTQNQNAVVDADQYERLIQWNWFAHWNPNTRSFYAMRSLRGGKSIWMHRFILGIEDERMIDHFNHDTLDNRKSNLRLANDLENAWNQRLSSSNKSGYKGVHFIPHNGTWRARINCQRKPYSLGCFSTPEAAALAYNEAAKRLHGDFALLNKLTGGQNK